MHYVNRVTDRELFTRDEVLGDINEDEPMYPGNDEEFDTSDDEMKDDYW